MRKTEFFWRVRAYAGERDTFHKQRGRDEISCAGRKHDGRRRVLLPRNFGKVHGRIIHDLKMVAKKRGG